MLLDMPKNRCDTTQSAVGHAHLLLGQKLSAWQLYIWSVMILRRCSERPKQEDHFQHNRKHLGVVFFIKVQGKAKDTIHSHVTGDGGVSGHRLGREVVVAVGAVEERLSPLAVDKIGLQDEA